MKRWILGALVVIPALGYYFLCNERTSIPQNLAEPAVTVTALADDGPYAFFDDSETQLDLKWICEQQLIETQQSITEVIAPRCAYDKPIQVRSHFQPEIPKRTIASHLAVLSDIHGQYELMVRLLQAHNIVDEGGNWHFADGHLVIVGDVMDRGDQVTEILWWLYQLEQQAEQSGGQLHLLLGNHETMVLYNDLRYINKKYQQVAQMMGTDYSALFAEHSVLGQWLRSKPVLAQINDMLFVHGGLHPDYLALGMSVAEVNEQYRQSLGIPRNELREVPVLNFLYGSLGPLWYRGYFRAENAISEPLLEQLLHVLNVKRIVVGHTSMNGVYSHFDGKVISVDSNIKRGKSGELLLWQDGNLSRGTLEGKVLPMQSLPAVDETVD